jgi:small acid-soluble spore protein P (minor)
MTKPETYPVEQPGAAKHTEDMDHVTSMTEPLSGSKKVKNKNHTGKRHGEGS